jgi:hypothetical protein
MNTPLISNSEKSLAVLPYCFLLALNDRIMLLFKPNFSTYHFIGRGTSY